MQTWESDRSHVVKSGTQAVDPLVTFNSLLTYDEVLQYRGSIANLRKSHNASADRSSTLINAYDPDNDLKALNERYRSGPFHPRAHVFESITHEEGDAVFGIGLRKWAEGGWGSEEVRKDCLPPILTTLLDNMNDAFGDVQVSGTLFSECGKTVNHRMPAKRKARIYEVPLSAVHHLREALNSLIGGTGNSGRRLGEVRCANLGRCSKVVVA